VGLPLALLADKKGYKVIGIDFSKIRDTSVVIICVPTPVFENHMPNLEPVENACKNIAPHLQKDQLVILESTVNPGVTESVVIPILEESGFKAGVDFYVSHCPERINPGDPEWTVGNIPRVVGSLESVGLEKTVAFYSGLITAKIMPMVSLKEAESVKIVENSFRDVNIAFVNELAMSFSRLGIDIANVINGAATKPFGYTPFYPGCGVGGHCIPVDPYYLIDYAKQNGFHHEFLSLARQINNGMPKFTAELAIKGLSEVGIAVKDAKIAVLGLAYKPEIDDCRGSPSFEIIKQLEQCGATVSSFDPFVLDKSTVKTLDGAVGNVDAVILATCHKVFKELESDYFIRNGIKVVVDGRNCLLKEKFIEAGIVYKGIGR
jgi:nucleotide sugar dehydrogenase